MTASDCYEYVHAGETVRLGVHCSGPACEPRIRWQIRGQTGKHGYIRLDAPESVVRLEGGGETVHLDGKLVSEIPVSHKIGQELEAEVEKLGTVITESNRINNDPAAFPDEIAGFERVGWESDRNVMWYWRDEDSDFHAYQIERGKLIFRAQEWADGVATKQELIDQYGLDTTL